MERNKKHEEAHYGILPVSCYFLAIGPKYSPKQPILEHPHAVTFRTLKDQVSHPRKTMSKIIAL
jgi:hypothetical protein